MVSRAHSVPWAVRTPDRIPKQRYYDPEFYAAEAELLWPKVWQMACRLEELPNPGDFVEYEILDQSIIVVRTNADHVRAYHNSCRHRGMKLVEGQGSRRSFVCPFHGWCWDLDGRNTFVLRPELFGEDNLAVRIEEALDRWREVGEQGAAQFELQTSTPRAYDAHVAAYRARAAA